MEDDRHPGGLPPPIPVFRGQGVQPGVDLTDNAALEDRMNAESDREPAGRLMSRSSTGSSGRFLLMRHRCLYFADRDARTVLLHPGAPRSAAAYAVLARAGFRRSGPDLYRPRCDSCRACIPTRVPVDRFRLGRRFRRVLKRNADLSVRVQPAGADDACFDLYARYINGRHRDGEMYPPSRSHLRHLLQPDWAGTFLLTARLAGRLVASAVTDTHDDGLSAIYTFFDPDLTARSLGVFSILKQVEECRRRGLPYLYLGYWIADSAKMRYKIDYQPLQLLIDGRWQETQPVVPARVDMDPNGRPVPE